MSLLNDENTTQPHKLQIVLTLVHAVEMSGKLPKSAWYDVYEPFPIREVYGDVLAQIVNFVALQKVLHVYKIYIWLSFISTYNLSFTFLNGNLTCPGWYDMTTFNIRP